MQSIQNTEPNASNSQLLKSMNMASNIHQQQNLVGGNIQGVHNNPLSMNASMDNLISQNQQANPKNNIYFAQNAGNQNMK